MLNRMSSQGACNCGNSCNCGTKPNTKPEAGIKAMLKKLQTIDFTLAELVLYLDAYPSCQKALNYLEKLSAERKALSEALAEAGAPVTAVCNKGPTWRWTDSPWPWEYEANI